MSRLHKQINNIAKAFINTYGLCIVKEVNRYLSAGEHCREHGVALEYFNKFCKRYHLTSISLENVRFYAGGSNYSLFVVLSHIGDGALYRSNTLKVTKAFIESM